MSINRIAGYLRKSILTDKGDSINSQKNIIRDYCERNYPDAEITFFEDEGFTGANTNRPAFQKLMDQVRKGSFDMLVCYKLDRISRSVSDFSATFSELQKHKVDFASVKEQIDTGTPIGRAMMYMSSVFAQMERETIAERSKDNLQELAKAGKWTGGRPPIGYKGEKRKDEKGKTYTSLIIDPVGREYVRKIMDTFLNGYTLTSIETKLHKDGITKPNGKMILGSAVYQLLKNPTYVRATPEVWDFFKEKGSEMVVPRESFDGTKAVIAFNRWADRSRTSQGKRNGMAGWSITKGLHEPMIEADEYLQVQRRLGVNKVAKTRQYDYGLLRGLIQCSCGLIMSAKRNHSKKGTRQVYWYYVCRKFAPQGTRGTMGICDVKRADLIKIDETVVNVLKEIKLDPTAIEKYIIGQDRQRVDKSAIKKEITALENRIDRISLSLEDAEGSNAKKYILNTINSLDKQIVNLKEQLEKAEGDEVADKKRTDRKTKITREIQKYMSNFESWSFEEKQNFIRNTIEKCVWNGDFLEITFL